MTEIEGEYLVTDEASVGAVFLGKEIYAALLSHVVNDFLGMGFLMTSTQDNEVDRFECIRIPRALVLELIEPVEGEAVVWGIESWDEPDGLVLLSADEAADLIFKDDMKYNWRLVNICQDYGELRKLVEWARG